MQQETALGSAVSGIRAGTPEANRLAGVAQRYPEAVVAGENGMCTGCMCRLPTRAWQVVCENGFVFCDSCGRVVTIIDPSGQGSADSEAVEVPQEPKITAQAGRDCPEPVQGLLGNS